MLVVGVLILFVVTLLLGRRPADPDEDRSDPVRIGCISSRKRNAPASSMLRKPCAHETNVRAAVRGALLPTSPPSLG
jgi:hypothetical protein